MKNKRIVWISWLLALLMVFTALSGCATNTDSAEHPAMWEVTDPDSGATIYLFGSIHAAEEDLFPLDKKILNRFHDCDYLAVEVDVLAYVEDQVKAIELSSYMLYMDGGSITDEIDEELVLRIQALLEAEEVELGVPMEMSVMFRPYTFISLLSNVGVEKAGLSAEDGVDMYFLQLARDKNITVLEIESMESQLEMFNSFSPELLTYLLEEALLVDAAGQEVRELYDAWKVGDLEALEATLMEPGEAPEEVEPHILDEYNEALLDDRNSWMADVAEDYLRQDMKTFYVVGALHMVGDDGIVQQLIDRGYQVERL